MELTVQQVLMDLEKLPIGYKTADVDRLIRGYVRSRCDASPLRLFILTEQQLHRIYYYVALKQLREVGARMEFIHHNLLFSDWWHTDQLIGFVADLELKEALAYAEHYVQDPDPFIRRWGYVLFISRLGRGHAREILPLTHNDEQYTVRMAQGWLISDLAVYEPEYVLQWISGNDLRYDINGIAIQKICDSYRISGEWKERFKALRPRLKAK